MEIQGHFDYLSVLEEAIYNYNQIVSSSKNEEYERVQNCAEDALNHFCREDILLEPDDKVINIISQLKDIDRRIALSFRDILVPSERVNELFREPESRTVNEPVLNQVAADMSSNSVLVSPGFIELISGTTDSNKFTKYQTLLFMNFFNKNYEAIDKDTINIGVDVFAACLDIFDELERSSETEIIQKWSIELVEKIVKAKRLDRNDVLKEGLDSLFFSNNRQKLVTPMQTWVDFCLSPKDPQEDQNDIRQEIGSRDNGASVSALSEDWVIIGRAPMEFDHEYAGCTFQESFSSSYGSEQLKFDLKEIILTTQPIAEDYETASEMIDEITDQGRLHDLKAYIQGIGVITLDEFTNFLMS